MPSQRTNQMFAPWSHDSANGEVARAHNQTGRNLVDEAIKLVAPRRDHSPHAHNDDGDDDDLQEDIICACAVDAHIRVISGGGRWTEGMITKGRAEVSIVVGGQGKVWRDG